MSVQTDRNYAFQLQKVAARCPYGGQYYSCEGMARYFIVPIGKRVCPEHAPIALHEASQVTDDIKVARLQLSGLRLSSGI